MNGVELLAYVCMQKNLNYQEVVRKYKTINEIEAFASKMMDEIREEEREVAEESGYIFPEWGGKYGYKKIHNNILIWITGFISRIKKMGTNPITLQTRRMIFFFLLNFFFFTDCDLS